MTDSRLYDGVGKLGDAIAQLYGFSPKNNNRIAERVATAKAGLGIASKAKVLPTDTKLAIWRWHYDRLHPSGESVNIILQTEPDNPVEIISHATDSALVEINSQGSQAGSVETFSPYTGNEAVEIISQSNDGQTVETFSQNDERRLVEIDSQYSFNDVVRIAFYTTTAAGRKRQVIALDGFYLNALMLATGVDKKDIPAWVQQAVDGWPAFDAELPITKQVKYLLIQELTVRLERLKDGQPIPC